MTTMRMMMWNAVLNGVRRAVWPTALMLLLGSVLWAPNATAGGTWTNLVHGSPGAQLQLLLTDGTVMAIGTQQCWKLTPDIHGSYVNGTWTSLAPMHYPRLYFASDVLLDGRVFVAGGEYYSGGTVAEVYDPTSNTWTVVQTSVYAFEDAESKLVAGGNVLVSPVSLNEAGGTVLYEPALNTWSPAIATGGDTQLEASWVKLPDDSVLTINFRSRSSQRYIPSQTNWVGDAAVPDDVWGPDEEEGGALLLPNTNAIFFGATGFNEIYTPSGSPSIPGTWQSGPVLPNGQATEDAPAAMMVNGRILCATSPIPSGPDDYPGPTSFYEYDYSAGTNGAFTLAPPPPDGNTNNPSYTFTMLDLPDGTVLLNDGFVYQPDGAPLAAGQPGIAGISPNPDGSYQLIGTLLNGISEGASYGDDCQMDSDYPIVRMTNTLTGNVYYARTYNRSSTSIMTGTNLMSTEFSVNAGVPWGSYSLVAVANGNASAPVTFYYPDALQVTPAVGFTSYGVVGGPFTVNSQTLTLTNLGTVPINWAVNNTNSWLTVSPSGGTLPAGGQATVSVSLSSTATTLPVGNYSGALTFTDQGNSHVQTVNYVLNIILAPQIVYQPTNQTVLDGNSAIFGVGAFGGQPLSLQWYFTTNGGPGVALTDNGHISGSATTMLVINNASVGDVGTYYFVASNPVGSATSLGATLGLIPSAPVITAQPASAVENQGASVLFATAAVGTKPFSYQWYFNGTPLTDNATVSGSATASLTLINLQPGQSGNYDVIVSNVHGAMVSSNAALTVIPRPTCDFAPSGLAGWWRFEGNVTDLLGLHNGNLLGAANTAAYVPGEVGQTLSFDGSHAVGLYPLNGAPNLGQGSGFTVEGWINPSDLTTAPVASWYGFNPNSNVKFMLECKPLNPSPGYLYAWIYDTNGTAHIVNGAANRTVVTNQFQHVALTYDSASGVAKIYWNGTMVGSNAVGASFFPSQQYYAVFGYDNVSTYFHGLIDELSFYTRALSQAEIQGIYASSFAGKCVPDITSQPQSLSVAAGGNATFSVTAIAGSGPLTYQWLFNGIPITNAMQATYSIVHAIPINAGQYAVVVSDASHTVLSASATLTVTLPTGLLAADYYHSLAVKSDGTVRSWGENESGEVGDGTLTSRTNPVTVSGLTGMTMVAAGSSHSLALRQDGTVWAWGLNDFGQIGGPYYTYGTAYFTTPIQVSLGSIPMTNMVSIAAGGIDSYSIKSDGTVWAWGYNQYGQLGSGYSGGSRPVPLAVPGLPGIKALAAGNYHILALATNGNVYAWGNNDSGELGNGTVTQANSPVLVTNLSNIVAITAGNNTSYALDSGGTVWVWGLNTAYQLGLGITNNFLIPVAMTNQVSPPLKIVGITAGYNHCLALMNDGTMLGWGVNAQGDLGDGTTTLRTTPVSVSFPDGSQAIGLAAGAGHSLSVQSDGTLRSWGMNYFGELGRTTGTNSALTPNVITNF